MKIVSQKLFEDIEAMERVQLEVEPVTKDEADLWNAFKNYFQPTCVTIGGLIGVENFRGGYEDMAQVYDFIAHIDTSTDEGKNLMFKTHTAMICWSAANQACVHEARKLRWKGAKWYKYCWEKWDSQPQPQPEPNAEA